MEKFKCIKREELDKDYQARIINDFFNIANYLDYSSKEEKSERRSFLNAMGSDIMSLFASRICDMFQREETLNSVSDLFSIDLDNKEYKDELRETLNRINSKDYKSYTDHKTKTSIEKELSDKKDININNHSTLFESNYNIEPKRKKLLQSISKFFKDLNVGVIFSDDRDKNLEIVKLYYDIICNSEEANALLNDTSSQKADRLRSLVSIQTIELLKYYVGHRNVIIESSLLFYIVLNDFHLYDLNDVMQYYEDDDIETFRLSAQDNVVDKLDNLSKRMMLIKK